MAEQSSAVLRAQQTADAIRQEIRETYNFSPHDLTDAQITAKSKTLDEFWAKAKANRDAYLSVLRVELARFTNPPFFLYDGAQLLLELSSGAAQDRKIALAAMAHCDLRDVNGTGYLRTVHRFRTQGDDVTDAAFLLLSNPQFGAFIPQHSLTLKQVDALLFLLLPMHPAVWLDQANDRLKSEKDPVSQRSLLTALWFSQTPQGDRAIAAVETSDAPAEMKAFAKELLKRNVDVPGEADASRLPTETEIRVARVAAMKDISDEAIDEVQRLTAQLILRRRAPAPDTSVAQSAVEAAIFRALIRDFAVPGRERYRKQTPMALIAVEPENLQGCPVEPVHGCVSADILASARTEAARGSWSFDLVSELETRIKDPLIASRLEVSEFERVVVVPRAARFQTFPAPTPFAMTHAAVRGKNALVVVQFAQLSTWLVLLTDTGNGWTVTKTVANGMS